MQECRARHSQKMYAVFGRIIFREKYVIVSVGFIKKGRKKSGFYALLTCLVRRL